MCSKYLKFDALNHLVDCYALNLLDNEKLFQLQAKEANSLLLKSAKIQNALKLLCDRILLLNSIQKEVQVTTEQIKCNLLCAEDLIGALETKVLKTEGCKSVVSDTYRQNTYILADRIDVSLTNLRQALEQIQGRISTNTLLNSDIEMLAQILQLHLQHLEQIELKIFQIGDKLNETNYLENACLRSYKLQNVSKWN